MSDNFTTPDRVYDYTQYSHVRNVNVIPEDDFKRLVAETFQTITETMRVTYGPYGRHVMISDQNETTSTKDGYHVFCSMGFSHEYKKKVYLAIQKICERVNRMVGDGTTSCILLADKMFTLINEMIKTPDDKRVALKILNDIERDLQKTETLTDDMDKSVVKPLTIDSIRNMLRVADNYDDELADVLMDALSPTVDDNGVVTAVRNVTTDAEVVDDSETGLTYQVSPLPGKYRVRVDMLDLTFAFTYNMWTKAKIAIFDHTFTASDWAAFMQNYDKLKEELVIILATGFTQGFVDNEYSRYLKNLASVKRPVRIIIAAVKGNFVQNEIKDLAALLKTSAYVRNVTEPIKHEDFPVATLQMFGGNCMCFDEVEPPTEYIERLKLEMAKELSKSYVKKKDYQDRIAALSLTSAGDTNLGVKGGTSLEVKLISDKIDDCVCIIQSALSTGVVPNMLAYGHNRINRLIDTDGSTSLKNNIASAIIQSIEGLFMDVWRSKYYSTKDNEANDVIRKFYDNSDQGDLKSYDIVEEVTCDMSNYPTASQYDLEVLVAAISIVKYLITSGAFIFDSFLLRNTGDGFQYNRPMD